VVEVYRKAPAWKRYLEGPAVIERITAMETLLGITCSHGKAPGHRKVQHFPLFSAPPATRKYP
jgi:hypothetical protein